MTSPALTSREEALLKVHLPYELSQLDTSFLVATSPAETDEKKLIRLMAIDCFYLHARNLIEFYKDAKTNPTMSQVSAMRFTQEPQKYPDFEEYMDAINDQVSHLQLDRGEHAKTALDGRCISQIKNKLDAALAQFQGSLRPDAYKLWDQRKRKTFAGADLQGTACTAIYDLMTKTGDLGAIIDGSFASWNIALETEITIMLPPGPAQANS